MYLWFVRSVIPIRTVRSQVSFRPCSPAATLLWTKRPVRGMDFIDLMNFTELMD